jgi:hypothetical protein
MVDAAVEKMQRENPVLTATVARVQARLVCGLYPSDWVDAVFQRSQGGPSTRDAFVFTMMWTWFYSGRVALGKIHLGAKPEADRHREENQRVLKEKLPAQFGAWVDPGHGDRDGRLDWAQPIEFTRHLATDARCTCGTVPHGTCAATRSEQWTVAPRGLSLEIGTTAASRTYQHILCENGVARWPYGSQDIFLLLPHRSLHEDLVVG